MTTRENWCNIIGEEITAEVLAKLPDKPFGYFERDGKSFAPTVYEKDRNGSKIEAVICLWVDLKEFRALGFGSRKAYFSLKDGEYIRDALAEERFCRAPM